MARRVTLVVAFACLSQNFGKVAGTYEWYFVCLECSLIVSTPGGGNTQTLIATIEFIQNVAIRVNGEATPLLLYAGTLFCPHTLLRLHTLTSEPPSETLTY